MKWLKKEADTKKLKPDKKIPKRTKELLSKANDLITEIIKQISFKNVSM